MTKEQATYAAPALEKGLDILELLAAEGRALTTRDIAERLGRSKNEIFRMVRVLINRGYIARDRDGEGLTLTNKLFALGMQTAKTRDLVAVAGPVVENLAEETRQSVHLVVANRGETVVIAAASGGSDMMFTLRLGYRRPLIDAHSGLLLVAFQPEETRRRMIQESIILMRSDVDMAALEADLATVRQQGSIIRDSRDIVGITDIASPVVLNDGRAVASLIVAYLNRRESTANYDAVREKVMDACANIAAGLEDYRPPAIHSRH